VQAYSLASSGEIGPVEIAEPVLGPEDVMINIYYVGLCGSDLTAYRGQSPMVSYPRIPGHEVSGTVVETGAHVPERISVGSKVMVSPYSACGLCPACRTGRPNRCEYNETLGVQREGALTEKIAVNYRDVFSSTTLTHQELALVEPLSVGYHATNRGHVCETDTVLVIGCGTIGIGAVAAAARKGAMVIAADIEQTKLATARRFGATYTVNTRENVQEQIDRLTQNEGVSVAIEAVGRPETYQLAVESVAYAGRVVCIGYAKQEVSFDTSLFVRKELDIRGSRNALRVFPAVITMLEQRERPFPELVSRIYPLAETAQAFADWDAVPGAYNKILIDVRA